MPTIFLKFLKLAGCELAAGLPFWSAVIAAGAALLGGGMQQGSNAKEARIARDAENAAALENRIWQGQMSSTAHQREVADLRAAGLNPILSGTGGMGSATPGGAKASAPQSAPAPNIGEAVASSALDARRNEAEVKNLEETNKVIKEDMWRVRAQGWQANSQEKLNKQLEETEQQRTRAERFQADILMNAAKGAKVEGDIDETQYGAAMRYLNRSLNFLGTGSSAAARARGGR